MQSSVRYMPQQWPFPALAVYAERGHSAERDPSPGFPLPHFPHLGSENMHHMRPERELQTVTWALAVLTGFY